MSMSNQSGHGPALFTISQTLKMVEAAADSLGWHIPVKLQHCIPPSRQQSPHFAWPCDQYARVLLVPAYSATASPDLPFRVAEPAPDFQTAG